MPNANIGSVARARARTVTVTPAANQSGTATITLTVSDGTGTASDTFVLTVNAVNDPPTISDIANQSTTTGTAVGPLSFTIGDVETAAASLTVSATSSNLTLVPTASIVFGGSGAARTVSVTPAASQTGTATITVTVSDGSGSASDAFVLTVTAPGPKTPTTTTLAAPAPLQAQYSDRMALSATISVPQAAQSVTFKVGTVEVGTAPIDATGTASLSAPLLGALGSGVKSLTATFNNINSNYTVTNPAARSIQVLREDAQFGWVGPTTLSRAGGTTVRLTVRITDMPDGNRGDVGTATVAFINRGTGATLGTVAVVPDVDRTTGTATFTWTAAPGTYTIGFSAAGQVHPQQHGGQRRRDGDELNAGASTRRTLRAQVSGPGVKR